ncbi:MAG TPA: hypothetical protein VD905_12300 [Flavobacteriales bacterium]|nr:hypothetical protein [Flavobacteriales bacterium]
METLDHSQSNSSQISERAIRNLQQSSVWIIIVSSVGLFMGLYFLYGAFQNMDRGYGRGDMAGVMLIAALIVLAQHILGLTYGIALSKLKIYSPEELDNASSKQMAYWVFCGIVSIISFLLILMAISNGGGRGLF